MVKPQQYTVEGIRDKKYVNKKVSYLVKWEKYPESGESLNLDSFI